MKCKHNFRPVSEKFHIGIFGKNSLLGFQLEDRSYMPGYYPTYCKLGWYNRWKMSNKSLLLSLKVAMRIVTLQGLSCDALK